MPADRSARTTCGPFLATTVLAATMRWAISGSHAYAAADQGSRRRLLRLQRVFQ
jgi:hypothetical protein